jgi:hypothetical protein
MSTAMGARARTCEAGIERDMECVFPFYSLSFWEREKKIAIRTGVVNRYSG